MTPSNKKNAAIVLAAVILAAFFMPWLTIFISASAWDLVFGQIGQEINSPVRFLAAVIPISAGVIIYSAGFNKEKYPLSKGLLFALPLITLVIIFIMLISKFGGNGIKLDEFIKVFGAGFWLTLIGSVLLTITGVSSPVAGVATANNPFAINPDAETQISAPENISIIEQPQTITEPAYIAVPQAAPDTPASTLPNDFFRQQSNLLLIASGLIFLGFFMPWVSVQSVFNSITPTINGTFIISQTNNMGNARLLIILLLLLTPVCPAIVAYDCYQKSIREKRITICIALATYLPVLVFSFYLFANGDALRELKGLINGEFSLGTGMLMMVAGSAYYLYYAIKNIAKGNKLITTKPLLKHGLWGGLITAVIYFLLMHIKSLQNSGPGLFFLVIMPYILPILSIVITNNLHKKHLGGKTNYSRVITLGCIVAVMFALSFYLLVTIFYSRETHFLPMFGSLVVIFIISYIQLGFTVSSIAGIWLDRDTSDESAPARPQFDFAAFAKKYKKPLVALLAIVVVGAALWYIFKPNPEKDGKKAAMLECDCTEKNTDKYITAYSEFLKNFSSSQFKRRMEAKNRLAEILATAKADDSTCLVAANLSKNELLNKFANNMDAQAKFQNAHDIQVSSFHATNETKKNGLLLQVNDKIATIVDPEPDTNAIKSDLIGKSIQGFSFTNISDVKQMTVTNVSRVPNQIDYTVDLKLVNHTSNVNLHNAEILVTYSYDGTQWSQVGLVESFITTDYLLPINDYVTVNPVGNCSWNASNSGKVNWKVCDNPYYEYQSGPTLPPLHLPNSACYMMKSLEAEPLIVTFTYKPSN